MMLAREWFYFQVWEVVVGTREIYDQRCSRFETSLGVHYIFSVVSVPILGKKSGFLDVNHEPPKPTILDVFYGK